MAATGVDGVSIDISQELQRLSLAISDRCIFKVHHQLRKINNEAYEPAAVSIGPYHHGNDKLRLMEEHKLRYFQLLLQRKNETNADRYVIAVRNLVEQARIYYADPIFYHDDKFVKIMLLDGCFIIELFREFLDPCMIEKDDSIFNNLVWLKGHLLRDLLLVENQLPFFVLEELFNMTKIPNENLIQMALIFFQGFCGTEFADGDKAGPLSEVRHLLGLIHWSRLPAVNAFATKSKLTRSINCATELREAGIIFKDSSEGCIFNLDFSNGVMKIPPIRFEDCWQSFFLNLIAYEQYNNKTRCFWFTDYIILFGCLINSPKDVKLLREARTIRNWLGDDEGISQALTSATLIFLRVSTIIAVTNGTTILRNLGAISFNSPTSFISFLAAVTLLFLTTAQTLFSIISYWKP